MYSINYTNRFNKDLKLCKKRGLKKINTPTVIAVIVIAVIGCMKKQQFR